MHVHMNIEKALSGATQRSGLLDVLPSRPSNVTRRTLVVKSDMLSDKILLEYYSTSCLKARKGGWNSENLQSRHSLFQDIVLGLQESLDKSGESGAINTAVNVDESLPLHPREANNICAHTASNAG